MTFELFGKERAAGQLRGFIESATSHTCVLYGGAECGKTTLVRHLLKEAVCIDVRECASMAVFLRRLSRAFSSPLARLFDISYSTSVEDLIVFDHVEYFERNLEDGARVMSILSRLPERHPVKVVFVARELLFFDTNPTTINLSEMSREDIVRVSSSKLFSSPGVEILAPLLYSVKRANGAVFPEDFTMNLAQLYPLFMKPVLAGRDTLQSFRDLRPKIVQLVGKGSLLSDSIDYKLDSTSSCLLVAAHLCRTNSAKQELVVFGEDCGRRKRNRKTGQSATKSKPRAVSLHRVLAVFYHIFPHQPPVLGAVLSALRGLFERKLILSIKQYERTDDIKVRCNLSMAKVHQISQQLGLDVNKFII